MTAPAMARERNALARRDVLAARVLRRTEGAEAADAARIEALAAHDRALDAEIAADEATLARLVALLATLRAAPLGGVLLAPGPLGDAPTALATLRGLTAGVAASVARLRAERAAQASTNAALVGRRDALERLHDGMAATRERVEANMRALTAAELAARADEAARAAATARAAVGRDTLRDAVATLAAAAPPVRTGKSGRSKGAAVAATAAAATATATAADERGASGGGGSFLRPVAGPIAVRFGAATASGPSRGLAFAPPPAALVSAPCAGTVEFAADFHGYGRTVIIRCGGDARVVLAGLAALDTAAGVRLRAGEPVGRMPDFVPGAGAGRPTLLLQLRRGAVPVDPGPLLR